MNKFSYGTDAITAAVRKHYAPPRWATALEVRDQAGFQARRSADVIAVSLWPSQGLDIHGIEVKSSASDLQKELDDPHKAESLAKYCDFWWLACNETVAASSAFERVPTGWGVRVLEGQKLKTRRNAIRIKPKPLDKSFVVSLLRRNLEAMGKMIFPSQIAEELERAKQVAEEFEVQKHRRAAVLAEEKNNKLQALLEKFYKATGIRLTDEWFDHTTDRKFFAMVKMAFEIVQTETHHARLDQLAFTGENLRDCSVKIAEVVAKCRAGSA